MGSKNKNNKNDIKIIIVVVAAVVVAVAVLILAVASYTKRLLDEIIASDPEINYVLRDSFPSSLVNMQDMTVDICANTPTPAAFRDDGFLNTDVPTKVLTDIRDNKTYTVAKLADGNCWMTQNLDLQEEDLLVAIDATNTDQPADYFTLPPSSKRDLLADPTTKTKLDFYEGTYVIDTADGTEYHNCLRYESSSFFDINNTGANGHCEEYDEKPIPEAELGNLYNWYTATAGTGTLDMPEGSLATGSICPKGWKLPPAADYSLNGKTLGYVNLLEAYGFHSDNDDYYGIYSHDNSVKNKMLAEPLKFTLSGYHGTDPNDKKFGGYDIGFSGYFWSSAAGNKEGKFSHQYRYYVYSLEIGKTSIDFLNSNNKDKGYAVRCMVEVNR